MIMKSDKSPIKKNDEFQENKNKNSVFYLRKKGN